MREFKVGDEVRVKDYSCERGEDVPEWLVGKCGNVDEWLIPETLLSVTVETSDASAYVAIGGPNLFEHVVSTLAPGDVVRLKSGGPAMTVCDNPASNGDAHVAWFVGNDIQRCMFPAPCLVRAEPPHGETRAGAGGV